ncbi:hypothetical protein BD779DRAFT_1504467 [Infundibulicybe gibba]|nr:hypothetical protein BD779DRAFT_1504467 [Infundibulicybe gibba]
MAGIDNIDDREIERGRHHGSSSSRESSPERQTQKRSFSPTSDDEGLVIPPTNDDDNTPAPPDRPLIRQPVGFSWNMSPSIATVGPINTYEASITVPAPTPYSTFFLPGQEVLSHPAFGGQSQNPEARESTTKTSGSRKKSKNGLPSQTGTGRFRLSAYDPTPAPGPSIQHGTGPYTSMFRGYTQNKPGGNAPAPPQQKARKSRAKSTAKSTPVGVSKTAGRPESRALGSATSTNRTTTTEPNALATPPRTPGYYRTDYEMYQTPSLDHAPPPSRTIVEHTALEPHAQAPFASHSTPHVDMINQGQSHQIETVEGGVKRVLRQLRMVTILMQDIRSGMTDHQLAEVKIPLRSADDPSEGFWADAKELCDKLQTSPSRIDGPARVYTLRGKYRQFFLRVSADNQDECISANIIISSERTLDVVIEDCLTEPLPASPSGALPSPPRIPKDLLITHPLDVPRNGNSRDPFKKRRREAGLGRREYDSDDDYDGHRSSSPSRSSNYSQSTYGRPTAANSPSASHLGPPAKKKQRSGIESAEDPAAQKKTLGASHRNQPRGYDSPRSDDEPDEFQTDNDWERVFISMACSQRVADILEQYRLVQMMVDRWTNRRAAFDSFYYPMKKEDIIRAFKIEDPNYGSHCTETLALLSLYGSGGRRLENRKVIDLVNDKSIPAPNSKPIKQLLRLLREIDTEWKDKHPAGDV